MGEEWLDQDIPGHGRRSVYSKRFSRGQHRYGADADWGVLDLVPIGATWRIRLNRLCAVAGDAAFLSNYFAHLFNK